MTSDESYRGINEKMINDWMVRQYSDQGFHEYFRKRDLQILKTIGTGLDEKDYRIYLGQRLELLLLLQRVDASWKVEEAKKGKLINNEKTK